MLQKFYWEEFLGAAALQVDAGLGRGVVLTMMLLEQKSCEIWNSRTGQSLNVVSNGGEGAGL